MTTTTVKTKGGLPDKVYVSGGEVTTTGSGGAGLATEAKQDAQIALLPASIGQKAKAGSLSVTLSSDEDTLTVMSERAAAAVDAFGRSRVSSPDSLLNSKMLFDNAPLFWDDSEVSGGSTTSTYSTNNASVLIGVAGTTAGKRVRQTFQRPDYQTGKSQQIFMTYGDIESVTGITKEAGLFDDSNGIFHRHKDGAASFVVRSFTSGAAVDNVIPQASWSVDPFDGTGPSGVTMDFSKVEILYMDFEWLGVGAVAFGFVINRQVFLAHIEDHANVNTTVYMSTPNLPIRYSIENDGTGAADTFRHICSTVISEGGQQETGSTTAAYTLPTHIDMNTIDTIYAGVGVRLKSTHIGTATAMKSVSIMAETNDDFGWLLLFNPTINYTAGGEAPISWTNKDNSGTQTAIATGGAAATSNTITAGNEGFVMGGGTGKSGQSIGDVINNTLKLGSAIDGTLDEIWLCVVTLSSNGDFQLVLNYQER